MRAVWENIKPRSCCIDRAIARSIQQDRGLIFSHTARTIEDSKFFYYMAIIRCKNYNINGCFAARRRRRFVLRETDRNLFRIPHFQILDDKIRSQSAPRRSF